ncbi:glutamate receptor ionotropic, delta-1-like [Babylonia areolata]|uniref:glutamate receptor ionotropic, delta-1-like n=1 Tax=Babylonia areolata TaxID=304850 RepID=UPI003FD454F1
MTDWLIVAPRDQVSSIATVAARFHHVAIVVEEPSSRVTLETIVRNEDNTRGASTVVEWSPCKRSSLPSLTKDMVFPNKKYGLGGRLLKIVTMTWSPFIKRHRNENHTWYTGLCIDLLHMLASKLNFTYVISEPADHNWGQQLSNGTWLGMTGMLHRKEADVALSGMSMTAGRASVSDYTRGFYFDELVLVTTFPDPTLVGWTFFTRPFNWLVFLLLGCGLVLMTLLLTLMDKWFIHVHSESMICGREKGRGMALMTSSLAQTAEVLFGTLLGRAVVYNGASTSGRVLLVAWLLLSMVIVTAYTGKLTSYSVVTKEPLPFRTLEELVKRSDYTWGFHLGTNSAFKLYKSLHCQMTTVHERLAQDTLTVYLQKGSPYTRMFDEIIRQATETGLMEYLTRKWFPEQKDCDGDETQVMSVSLKLVPVAFLLAAGGLTLASGTLLLEFLTRNNRGQRQQDKD